jgi:hypothetical protein
MRSSVVLLLSIVLVSASIIHDSSLSARHARISRRESALEVHVRAVAVKRCPNLKNKAAAAALARSSVSFFYVLVLDLFLSAVQVELFFLHPSCQAIEQS